MISKDDEPITPPLYTGNIDSTYFFNKGLYKGKISALAGYRPKGIFQNNNIPPTSLSYFTIDQKDLQFIFADSDLTPLTLTTQNLQDGNIETYPNSDEPLINKAMIMNKEMILGQLAEEVNNPYGDPKGTYQKGAFDEHLSNIWALKQGSSGWKGPFDYSTKNYFADRVNYLFITNDGTNVVGHNFRNMGNFLWGAATYILGIPQWMALSAAHWNNLTGDQVGWDTPDDQYSIKLGRYYAKINKWSDLAGKGNKNILK
jgi:hypothetical protein